MTSSLVLSLLLLQAATAWVITPLSCSLSVQHRRACRHDTVVLHLSDENNAESNKFDQLMDMDIVLFSRRGDNKQELGAMQEDGTIAPISVWTLEPAYDTALAFVVDEVDRFPGLTAETCEVVEILDEHVIGYGSRQLFGGKGPGNPHGEESEQLYYVEQEVLESKLVEIVVKAELEIQW